MSRGEDFLILHGHFYQPPRENPWLDYYEPEHTAAPYRDWNLRIARECYGPNAYARITGSQNRVFSITNNFEGLSFDFGPTLLKWLEKYDPRTYEKVLEGDRLSRERTGFGNALAHPFNHVIMPLASEEEKTVQVRWGIRDFRGRFGREPEGMWLPETAADIETLAALAREGIKFTVLAPRQARRIRPLGGGTWCEVDPATLDTTVPYLKRLPGGLEIVVFFFHGLLSHEVAFGEGLKSSPGLIKKMGEALAARNKKGPGLITLATDGETFGHHFKFGEMGVAALFREAASTGLITPTNFAHFLSMNPPAFEVEIEEDTSWSCAHGIERWRGDCGCRLGDTREHQRWRGPLREALDKLSEKIDALYVKTVEPLVNDPLGARDAYIEVVLEDTAEARESFLKSVSKKDLSPGERKRLLIAMEMQNSRLAMFTSCGWFFNEISGLETVLILKFAARACDLALELGEELEKALLDDLARAPSNKRDYQNGRGVYLREVVPARPDVELIAAAWAGAALLGLSLDVGSFRVDANVERLESSDVNILGGAVTVFWDRTGKINGQLALAKHPRGGEVKIVVKGLEGDGGGQDPAARLRELVSPGDLAGAEEYLYSLGGARHINLHALPPGIRDSLLAAASRSALDRMDEHMSGPESLPGPILELADPEGSFPSWLKTLTGLVLDFRVARTIEALGEGRTPAGLASLMDQMAQFGHEPDYDLVSLSFNRALENLTERRGELSEGALQALLGLAGKLDPDLDFWELQNRFYDSFLAPGAGKPEHGRHEPIHRLGEFLGFSREMLAGLEPPQDG